MIKLSKLALSKETLITLAEAEQFSVNGGMAPRTDSMPSNLSFIEQNPCMCNPCCRTRID